MDAIGMESLTFLGNIGGLALALLGAGLAAALSGRGLGKGHRHCRRGRCRPLM